MHYSLWFWNRILPMALFMANVKWNRNEFAQGWFHSWQLGDNPSWCYSHDARTQLLATSLLMLRKKTNTSYKTGDPLDFCATLLLCWQRQFGVDHGSVISATTPDFTPWVGGGYRSSHLSNVNDEVLKCGHSKQFWWLSGWQNVIWSDLQLLLMFLMYKTIHKRYLWPKSLDPYDTYSTSTHS